MHDMAYVHHSIWNEMFNVTMFAKVKVMAKKSSLPIQRIGRRSRKNAWTRAEGELLALQMLIA